MVQKKISHPGLGQLRGGRTQNEDNPAAKYFLKIYIYFIIYIIITIYLNYHSCANK